MPGPTDFVGLVDLLEALDRSNNPILGTVYHGENITEKATALCQLTR